MELFEIVKTSFADIGIEMEVWPMESAACTALVEARKYDQLVYRPYGPLGHTYAPFQAVTRLHSRSIPNWSMVNDPVIDGFYTKALATTTEEELKPLLHDMNERVARLHCAVSLLKPMEYSLYQPWLKGYTAQIHSVWMGVGGPSRLSLYGARYWIDSELKKSMLH
jgi:ABC-type transport system substrate-binding protein